jgi:limonene-1,2-epoxide hydrolase
MSDAATSTFSPTVRTDDPRAVVEAFLGAMAAGDSAAAAELIDDDILYVNVGMPPMRGAARVRKVLAMLDRPSSGFDVVIHSIAADGPVVLTERTDVLVMGRWSSQFWVYGRFEVRDGRITLWRDSFDYVDVTVGMLRGALAMLVPALAPARPAPGDAPGRRATRR